jgi:quercetin dioxygenase-like cupin family protein/dTDP-glucose pyrophosphorylase
MTKTIYKPWGKEVWLELNDQYCYKRIYINAGTKTSYQYHNFKLETNYIIEGEAEVWLENKEGIVEKKKMFPGDYFTIHPPKKHRVIALTDVILQEVSTPHVDDVIRIEDDSARGDGKIEHEHNRPALCILTAGLGKRMGGMTAHINKGLLPLDNKALISHLIEKTPSDYEIVLPLGYKGEVIKEYCEAAHPNRDFIFVTVDKYEGAGTGPGYSISQCKKHLQRPFIWATADAIINNPLPPLRADWLGVYPTDIPELYSTAQIQDGKITSFKNKETNGYKYAFIGVAGVYDYKTFWQQIDISNGEIVTAYYNVGAYKSIHPEHFDWYDAGTIDNYLKASRTSKNYSIPKTNGEFLYKVNNNFIKLCSDQKFISGRIARAKHLNGLCPAINYKGQHLYSYKWIEGETLYERDSHDTWNSFLSFAQEKMWKPHDVSDTSFQEVCKKFYYDKTHERLDLFLSTRDNRFNDPHTVNDVDTPPIKTLLSSVDMRPLYEGLPTQLFHGDLQFDNVICSGDDLFYLLDWRQDFGGSYTGDVYYDLAKMYGGILMSYKLMKDTCNFSCRSSNPSTNISFKHKSTKELQSFQSTYERWVQLNNYDLHKVKIITALIFLNMAPLHEKEFGDLLFFKSKLMLNEVLP